MRNETRNRNEKIELTLPVNAAYVSAARLTASSISNRVGFNIEDIEDIKAAVSEACIFLIHQCMNAGEQNFHLEFLLNENTLDIQLEATISCEAPQGFEEELGIKMIQAMMNKFEISSKDGIIQILMSKRKKEQG